jgi:glycosyltransferase involved in cell wall biosynthesis
MRILFITPILVPPILWAGSHRVVYDISKALSKRGHEVIVLTSDIINIKEKKKINSKIDTCNHVKIVRNKIVNFKLTEITGMTISTDIMAFLKKALKDFDVVHAHEYRTYENIVLHHYAKKYDITYLLQAHGSLRRDDPKRSLKWVYDIFFGYSLLKDASKVIALTPTEAEQYMSMGVPKEKIAIIPNGIDLSEYAELPPKGSFKKKFNIPEDRKIILYLGRIHKIKGIDFLIRAYAYLKNKMNFKDAVLVIAGPDDGYLSEVKSLVHDLSVSNSVLFVGSLYGGDKLAAYVDSEVYILSSRYETFGMTVLEAYACGKPVIASDVGGLKELIVDGETGFLFEAGNFKQMAEKIVYLLNNSDKAVEIGRKARILVEEKYSIDKVVDMIERLYSEVAL